MRAVAAVVTLAACLHAGVWAYFQPKVEAPDIPGPLASVSYAPFEGVSRADDVAKGISAEQIRRDLKAIAPYTNTIRTYRVGGLELVPQIAAEFGLRVTLGVWISGAPECSGDRSADKGLESKCTALDQANEREIRAAVELSRRHTNVNAIVVGNETTLRREKTIDELVALIKRVKRQVNVPVTTGETWDVWIDRSPIKTEADRPYIGGYKLAAAVDFIAAHVLPYWDRVTADQAADYTVEIYRQLRHAHEGKHIMLAEVGYPSSGYNRVGAMPGVAEQGVMIRNFVERARALGIDYNIIEAYDQPWKTIEGSVGSYWGLFDTSRTPKFAWTGPITNPNHIKLAAIAVAIGLLVSLPILGIAGATFGQALVLTFASHVVGAWSATVFDFWNMHYFVPGAAFAFFFGMLLLIPLILIALYRVQEIATVLFGRGPRRLLPLGLRGPDAFAPKVSIHIPAYRESPEMLKATLDSVANLNYPNFECVVVINNTPDPAFWRPIEDHCQQLGERFKFLNVDGLKGFKAGALRLALDHTAPDAEIIGVLDADYVVQPDWLKDVVPAFADPKVGLVQAPQDHRDENRSVLHHAMNGEYAGFFDIGMVQRNENNAIIVHGTMCLVRRAALEQAGGWSSDTICEDTDLGLTILENGWVAHYTNRRYGHGLLPDTFEAFKKQRDRWAYGGVQIARKHWRRLLPGANGLGPDQRREFAMGWLNWLGAESVGVVMAILNLLWVPIVAFVGIAIPDKILTLPILAAFAVSVFHFVALYRARVTLPVGQTAAAMIAAMSMQWTVARAVGMGLVRDHLPFVVTAKGGVARKRLAFPAFHEAIMAGLLIAGAITVFATNYEHVREVTLFGVVLLVQSVPFIAAVALAAMEESRLNSFAFWRSMEARLTQPLRPRTAASIGSSLGGSLAAPSLKPPAMADIAVVESVQAPEQRIEAVQ